MSSIIIDRRKNPQGKSLNNRQRFVGRAKKSIQDAARRKIAGRSINDTTDADISIPHDGIDEPQFHHDREFGEYDYVLPGNKDYVPGDSIYKPESDPNGMGRGGSSDGPDEDDFDFALSYDEYLNIIFEDLELPDMVKQSEKNVVKYDTVRAGHTSVGIPANLNVERTAIAGLGRRIALRSPKMAKIKELEEQLAQYQEILDLGLHPETHDSIRASIPEIEEQISVLRRRANAVTFLDDVDLRFNNFVKHPRPSVQAVMICVMDVSGSMGNREKTIAKKFFLLLSLFLRRQYRNIDVVFVRHHDTAIECDEDAFFNSRESGGTVVSTAYEVVQSVISARYPVDDWNIYLAQVSDGDNSDSDNPVVLSALDRLLPMCQHFNYIEVPHPYKKHSFWGSLMYDEGLWKVLKIANLKHRNMDMAQIDDDKEVISVFRKLFSKDRE